MQARGIQIDYRMLAVATAEAGLRTQPTAARIAGTAGDIGLQALARSRTEPENVSLTHWFELADAQRAPSVARLCARELSALTTADKIEPDALNVLAVPSNYDASTNERLAAVARAAGLTRVAYVDAAAAIVAASQFTQGAVVVELGWQHILASAVPGGASFARRFARLDSARGLDYLYRRWMDVIAAAMVKQTRFDPLHDRSTEQALFDALPALLTQATQDGMVRVELPAAGATYATEISAQWLEEAAAVFYRQLLRLVLGVQDAAAPLPLLLPECMRTWPGFAARVLASTDQAVRWLPEGYGARAALQLADLLQPGIATWRVAALPAQAWQREWLVAADMRPRAARAVPITHALFGGESLRLLDATLVIGRDPGAGVLGLRIDGEVPGVSRRHCSIVREDGRAVVIDHSRHGTWLNNARVVERAPLQPGDRLRVGIPGVEITLISAAAADGAPQA
jgi:FHA domain